MVRNMYILWDMVFVICMGIICRYFVGHGSYIYIYTLWETWDLKMYERYVWVFRGECVWKIYGSVRWIIWKLNVAKVAVGVVFCVMTLIMLLSKKGDFVWEIKNEMEMCFEQQKWWSFRIMECRKDEQWIMVCCNMCVVLLSIKRGFVREIGKCENVYFAAKWVKFLHKRVREDESERKDQRGGVKIS